MEKKKDDYTEGGFTLVFVSAVAYLEGQQKMESDILLRVQAEGTFVSRMGIAYRCCYMA